MPSTNSLTFRLIAGAAIWTVLGLVVGGFILSEIFRNTVESSFDSQLKFNLDGLVAAAESDEQDHVTLEGRFTDPRFELVFSGWYWQIRASQPVDAELQPQTSRSLWDQTIEPRDLVTGQNDISWGYADGPDGQQLRVLMQRIRMPVASAEDVGQAQNFDFVVAGDISETEANIALFNQTLQWSIALFSLGLIAAMLIQVRVGLMPLRAVSEALARIREGRARRLEGEFPTEIAPLATELNSLISHSSEVVGRARGHVANLAHFLKTPLTVLANEAATAPGPLAETVARQVQVMRRQVDHYLARARAAGALDVLGSRTEIAPVLNDLARVLKRMHAEKELEIQVNASPALAFRGEREDLEEMAGNLIDNACKWAHRNIKVDATPIDGARFSLCVSDDGPGLEPEERARAMQRGERFDESVPGTGLGLAIVRDIAKLYGGSIALDESPMGGLEVKLELPRAR